MNPPSGFFTDTVPPPPSESHYEVEKLDVSVNGFTQLYKVQKDGKYLVCKCLKPEFRGDPIYEKLLKKEYEIGSRMDHPGVCKYLYFGTHDVFGNYIATDFLDGVNLDVFLKRKRDWRTNRKLAEDICDALYYIHSQQIIHRDLKPSNIVITNNGKNAKILDFGLSDGEMFAELKFPAGTKHYAAPELLEGKASDQRADIYSLGIILDEISPRFRRIAAKCCRENPEDRYQNALQVKRAILWRPIKIQIAIIAALALLVGSLIGGVSAKSIKNALSMKNPHLLGMKDPVPIEDPEFANDLAMMFDRNGNGIIEYSEALKITELTVDTEDLVSLQGIEYFANLRILRCYSGTARLKKPKGKLTSLDLSGNPQLEELHCDRNMITELNLSGNPKLKNISCEDNQLTRLDVSENPELEILSCFGNPLEGLDVSACRDLHYLDCTGEGLGKKRETEADYFENIGLPYQREGKREKARFFLPKHSTVTVLRRP